MKILHISKIYLLGSLLSITYVYAARPFLTDDARVVDRHHCQLESYIKVNEQSEFWALPACNFLWNTELTLGAMVGIQTHSAQFQLKKLFVNTDEKGWGIGISVGNLYKFSATSKSDDIYFYLPASVEFFDARLVTHLNVGYNLSELKNSIYTAGIGAEIALYKRKTYLVAETYYTRFEPLLYQVGLRTWLVQDIVQIDSTYGNAFSGKMGFVSIGLRFLPKQKIF
ncbi:hypothetical protein [Helicobacter fennelliae]|uniref:Outer membrane protein n=1 Tax=Helicobacter fennelliae TaxID=215 RepID=A0A2X3BG75_9HELI|nr:hypothetical protein [Helicobacter fennelliae]SQB99653.1 outer membrane protein [Helicobacter fennelliae]STQ85192.1 outer membrane protein [Helicobacter fennelliae]